MAEENKAETYGVGPSAKKMNIGQDVNQFQIVDEKGIAYQDGEATFDPTDNAYEVIQDDGEPDYEEKDNDAKEQSKKAVRNIVKGR